MTETLREILEKQPVEASAPCRVDMGGTLDISTFYFPLQYLKPCTFNIAIGLRTRVRLLPYQKGVVKVSSNGFTSAEFPITSAPFDHPLGLIFAVAAYFNASGVHIVIESSSPPKSALGGSSAATVALVAACQTALGRDRSAPGNEGNVALTAQALEASVAGVPCGLQDQLAAVYGGVNAWYWQDAARGRPWEKLPVIPEPAHQRLKGHLLLAYCGKPHESKNINGKWVRQFISGENRRTWEDIVRCTHEFVDALKAWHIRDAAAAMNAETALRRRMTPDVLDPMGEKLVAAAVEAGCGARFTGAGGGGCLWAIGEKEDIERLRVKWKDLTAAHQEAGLLDINIDSQGLMVKELR